MYAVLETGGKQYRVKTGETLEIERISGEPGSAVTFNRILMVSDGGKVSLDQPSLRNAGVVVDIVEHRRGEKKIAFKMKRRKGYHRTVGHRQELTVIKVKEIKL